MCGREGATLPPPEGVSNPQPVLRHAGVVSAHNWSTGDSLCDCDADVLAEDSMV